ncbi:hypothetical protein SeMB42_g00672 [Synchytrium endobioticum]|uniref:NADPH-dependent diflavin oxidoreductase 1 n=1 Tax=Synchytrium endobioticum TaxID=286115 RepID=A0A507DBP5_9FUNG|nr:hypothetical protein SeLEV6574_g02154 [Synchytrium endobioticum]TPX53607.1 hypothetical protein SeMB42_g00672 [Synchytrium endobioticum]
MDRSLLVLYGTQTGNAQEVADRIVREARRLHFNSVRSMPMDEYTDRSELVKQKLVIFVCSTTGQGEEPDNMKSFWKFLLRRNLPSNLFSGTSYAVFGLGDTSYPKYNFPAKKLHKRLAQLGAHPVVYRGDGDDQHELGIDGALDTWLEALWQKISQLYPLPSGIGGDNNMNEHTTPAPSYCIEFLDVNGHVPTTISLLSPRGDGLSSAKPKVATVKGNSRITASDHDQDTRHLIFEIDKNVRYSAGDVMVVYPRNLPSEVQEFINHCQWHDVADRPIQLIPTRADIQPPKQIVQPTTLRTLLTSHIDIFGRPKRYFFELASYFATNGLQAGKLREFASAAGQSDLYAYCHRMRRTTFEVLQDFASIEFPIEYLLDLIPAMRPRSFSIASSPSAHPGEIHLCVAIVEYYTRMKKARTGVCTKWMRTLQSGDHVLFTVARGSLKLPADATPAIFIAPGTGIAPMRALIHERAHRGSSANVLFFGFRSRSKDYYYQNELALLVRTGGLQLYTAASQDQDFKIYVQHRMHEQAALIWRSVHEMNGVVFLSGSSTRIPKDVTDALVQICVRQGNMDAEQAEAYVASLQKEGRYLQDCWS